MSTAFPSLEAPATPAAPTTSPTPPLEDLWAEPPQPATPTQPFLRVNDTTVYMTPEAAQKGWNDHQAYIHQLENQLVELAGTPSTPPPSFGQAISTFTGTPSQAPPPLNAQQVEAAFRQAISQEAKRVVQEQLSQALGPLAPVVQHANLSRAVEAAAQVDPNIRTFVQSRALPETLKQLPTLRGLMDAAQYDPRYAAQLPEMLVLAYHEFQRTQSGAPTTATQPSRTTAPGSTAPAAQTGGPATTFQGVDIRDIPLAQLIPPGGLSIGG